MLGDAAGMTEARGRAATAMAQLGPPNLAASVYSVPRADDPPYTATSLLLTGSTRGGAADAPDHRHGLPPPVTDSGDQPTDYARTLLILALAAAGLGELDEAVAAGTAALECGRVVWPTIVLAGKLDQALAGQFPPRRTPLTSTPATLKRASGSRCPPRGRQEART